MVTHFLVLYVDLVVIINCIKGLVFLMKQVVQNL